MCPIPLTPLTAAVRTLNVPNVSSSSRDLALVASCFLRTDFLSARFPRRFFEQMSFAFRSVPPGVSWPGYCLPSSGVLGAALPPRLDFSIVGTVAYSRVSSEHFSSPRFGSHVFRGGDVPTGTIAAGNEFALLGFIAASRCCWQAYTVSIDEFSHQSMS